MSSMIYVSMSVMYNAELMAYQRPSETVKNEIKDFVIAVSDGLFKRHGMFICYTLYCVNVV